MDTINEVLAKSAHVYFTNSSGNYFHNKNILTDLLRNVLKSKRKLNNGTGFSFAASRSVSVTQLRDAAHDFHAQRHAGSTFC